MDDTSADADAAAGAGDDPDEQKKENEVPRCMADAIPALVWVMSQDTLTGYFNQPWLRFTGRDGRDAARLGWTADVHPDDLEACLSAYLEALQQRAPFEIEHRLRRFDDSWRWMRTTGMPWFDAAGGARLAGYTITCRDVTEQKQSEAERERVRRENERLLGALLEAGTRGHAFLRKVLDHLSGGRLFLCEDDTDLPAPLPALAPVLSLRSAVALRTLRKSVEVATTNLTRDESPPPSPAVWERRRDFLIAVSEAAMNALVHGREGTARLHADAATGRLQAWVRDQGPGIPKEMLHQAAMDRGYSTLPGSFGFWLTIQTADRVYLRTGEGGTGTTLVLEQDTRRRPAPPDDNTDRSLRPRQSA